MIADLKPYLAMKDSGVAWLGAVPDHWQVPKLKYVVSFSGGGTPSKANASFWSGHIPWVSPKDMTHSRINNSADHITEEALAASATSVVAPGALLMVVRSGILRRTIPVGINTVDVALNQDMKALRPRPGIVQSEYLRLLVQGNEAVLIREWTKQGATVESIEHEFLANSLVPLPLLSEQAVIVRFLDYADRRIRRYLRAKQKLIRLLEEQKQAIINRAVTRGLAPNVRLRPSGVEWLGDVPDHWEVRRLKSLTRIRYGLGQPPREFKSGLPLIRATNIDHGRIIEKDLVRVDRDDVPKTRNAFLQEGETIVVRSGAYTADSAIIPREYAGAVAGYDMVVTPAKARPAFLALTLLASYVREDQLVVASMRSAPPHLNAEELGVALIMVPPDDEQDTIIEYVARSNLQLDATIEKADNQIRLLKEYRTWLVADVVTGKLDVRETAARLPEEIEEPQPLDESEIVNDTGETTGDLDAAPEEAEA